MKHFEFVLLLIPEYWITISPPFIKDDWNPSNSTYQGKYVPPTIRS